MDETTITQCAETLSTLGCEKSANKLSFLANLLAILISEGKSADQTDLIANFLGAVGAILSVMASQKGLCEAKQDKLKQIRDLKKQIKDLEASILG